MVQPCDAWYGLPALSGAPWGYVPKQKDAGLPGGTPKCSAGTVKNRIAPTMCELKFCIYSIDLEFLF